MGGWSRKHNQGGLAIRRAVAALLLSSLFFVTSVAVAHADPDFVLVEAEARAGDIVHFSITGAKGPVTYELEIGHHDVVEDAVGTGSVVTGEFFLPHLGDSGRTVTVKAEIREPGDKTTVKRKLHYLGPAPAATHPTDPVSAPEPAAQPKAPPPPSAPAPSVLLPTALPPEPASATHGATAPASRTPAARRRSRHGAKQDKVKKRGHTPSSSSSSSSSSGGGGGGKPSRHAPRRKTRAKRPAPRTAPLFDGVPEPGAEGSVSTKEDGYASRDAPPAAVLTGTRAASGGDSMLSAAVLVPGLMGVAALVLTGATLHRRRRLR